MKIFHEINMLGALIIVLASFSLISNDEREVVKSNNSIRLLKNGDVELLIKEYTHISGKYHITYINTLHFGEKNFYEEINKKIKGKMIIYESSGSEIKIIKNYNEAIKKLDEEYQKKYDLIDLINNINFLIAKSFALSIQAKEVNLDSASFPLHVDTKTDEKLLEELSRSPELLKKKIDENARFTLNKHRPSSLEEILEKEINRIKEIGLSEIIDDVLSSKQIFNDDNFSDRLNSTNLRIKQVRPLMEKAISSMTQLNYNADVVIVYGALHFLDTDRIIKANNFIPVAESWLKLLNINDHNANSDL